MRNILLFTLILTLSYCVPVHHGYKFEDKEQIDKVKEMVTNDDSISQIISYFGSPSFINSPFNDTICYISADGKRVAFNRFYNPTYHLLCFTFKENKVVDLIDKDINNLKEAKFTKYKMKLNKKDFELSKQEINKNKNNIQKNSNVL